MAELLFVATMIFVAYVVFVVMGDKKEPAATDSTSKPAEPPVAKTPQPENRAEAPAATPQAEAAAPAKPAKTRSTRAKPAAAKSAAATQPTSPAAPAPVPSTTPADSIKNPLTGEVAKIPGNYAFAKRWIKEALVSEGLLEKIYKNNELNDAISAQIQDALVKLKSIDKYR